MFVHANQEAMRREEMEVYILLLASHDNRIHYLLAFTKKSNLVNTKCQRVKESKRKRGEMVRMMQWNQWNDWISALNFE